METSHGQHTDFLHNYSSEVLVLCIKNREFTLGTIQRQMVIYYSLLPPFAGMVLRYITCDNYELSFASSFVKGFAACVAVVDMHFCKLTGRTTVS